MCKVYPSSLGDLALKWFSRLEPRSIRSFRELAEAFVTWFVTNSKQPKDVGALLTLKKQSTESLKEYSTRYWRLYNKVEGNNEHVAVATFKLGLPKENQLRQSLTKRPPITQGELMERIEEFIKLEEDMGIMEPRWTRTTGEESKLKRRIELGERTERRTTRSEPPRSAYERVYTIFKELIYRILT